MSQILPEDLITFYENTIAKASEVNANLNTLREGHNSVDSKLTNLRIYNVADYDNDIAATITAAGSNHGYIYHPKGTYTLTSNINYGNNVAWFGSEAELTSATSRTVTFSNKPIYENNVISSLNLSVVLNNVPEITLSFWKCPSSPSSDDSPWINSALQSSDHLVIKADYDNLYIKTPIITTPSVTFEGKPGSKTDYGTTLNIYYGKNSPNSIAILLDSNAIIRNFNINYPEQVLESGLTPVVFGPCFGSDISKPYNIDYNIIENIYFINAYYGINLDKAGSFTIKNISGNPIYRGIKINRCYNVPYVEDIWFWPSTYTTGDIYNWIQDNCIAIELNRVDGLQGKNWFSYAVGSTILFKNDGYGTAWGHLSNLTIDRSNKCIDIQEISSIGFSIDNISAYPTSLSNNFISTSNNIGGLLMISNASVGDNSSVPVVISSSTGEIRMSNVKFLGKYDNKLRVINENSCNVVITNSNVEIIGGAGFIDGINMPYSNTEVTELSNLDMTSWAAGKPNNWDLVGGSLSNIAQISNGIRFSLNNSINALHYKFLAGFNQMRDLYILEFDYTPQDITSDIDFRFSVSLRNDTGTKISIYYGEGGWALLPKPLGQTTKIRLPIIIQNSDNLYYDGICFEVQSYGYTTTNYIDITNIKLYKQRIDAINRLQIDHLSKHLLADGFPFRVGSDFDVIRNRKIIYRYNVSSPPTYGVWNEGDIIYYDVLGSDGYMGCICITSGNFAGVPPVFKQFGLLNEIQPSIVDANTSHTLGGTYDSSATNLALNSLGSKINEIITRLESGKIINT